MPELTRNDMSTGEDGFHEIQLSGKQLVFLFMATTIVAVVIFLCGVQVGRGVRTDRTPDSESMAAAAPAASAQTPSQPAVSSGPPAAEPPAPAQEPDDDLSYAKRLQGDAPAEQLKPPASAPAPAAQPKVPAAAPAATSAAPQTAPAKPANASAASSSPTDAGSPRAEGAGPGLPGRSPEGAKAGLPGRSPEGAKPSLPGRSPEGAKAGKWIVQVHALKDRAAANGIAQRLASKGYPAFVLDPEPGSPVIYRVQVGRYGDRSEAEQVARRLERDEQYKPIIHSVK